MATARRWIFSRAALSASSQDDHNFTTHSKCGLTYLENIAHVKHLRKIGGYFDGVFRLGLVARTLEWGSRGSLIGGKSEDTVWDFACSQIGTQQFFPFFKHLSASPSGIRILLSARSPHPQ
jgi:hypothetical protein